MKIFKSPKTRRNARIGTTMAFVLASTAACMATTPRDAAIFGAGAGGLITDIASEAAGGRQSTTGRIIRGVSGGALGAGIARTWANNAGYCNERVQVRNGQTSTSADCRRVTAHPGGAPVAHQSPVSDGTILGYPVIGQVQEQGSGIMRPVVLGQGSYTQCVVVIQNNGNVAFYPNGQAPAMNRCL